MYYIFLEQNLGNSDAGAEARRDTSNGGKWREITFKGQYGHIQNIEKCNFMYMYSMYINDQHIQCITIETNGRLEDSSERSMGFLTLLPVGKFRRQLHQ